LFLVVSTSAIDCLERVVSEMTYYVLSVEWDVKSYTLTHFPPGPRLLSQPRRSHPLAGADLYCMVTEAHRCK